MKAIQVAIALGIAILLPLLAEMTVRIFAEPPEYLYEQYPPQPKTPEERQKANAAAKRRQAEFEAQQARFNLQVFYVAFPLGILEIIGGFLLRRRPTLAAGIIFGGLSTVACGSFSSWETLPGWARYASLLFALGVLVFLAAAHDASTKREREMVAASGFEPPT